MNKVLPAFLTGFTIFEDFFFDFSSFISESISSIIHKTPPLRGNLFVMKPRPGGTITL